MVISESLNRDFELDFLEIIRKSTSKASSDIDSIQALDLVHDLGLDSLDVMTLLYDLEETYDVQIADEDIISLRLTLLDHLATYIWEKTQQGKQ